MKHKTKSTPAKPKKIHHGGENERVNKAFKEFCARRGIHALKCGYNRFHFGNQNED